MTTNRQINIVTVLVVLTKALLISLALVYLAEYAELPLVREAGGGAL